MAGQTFRTKVGGIWDFQLAIPSDLRDALAAPVDAVEVDQPPGAPSECVAVGETLAHVVKPPGIPVAIVSLVVV